MPSNISVVRAVGERAIDDVAVAGDPADVGRAPVDIAGAVIEHALVGERGPQQIAAGGVQHALGLAGRARGVEDEQRILGVHRLGRGSRPSAGGASSCYQTSRPPFIGTSAPVFLTTMHLLDAGRLVQRRVDVLFQRNGLAAAAAFVGGDDDAADRNR